MVEAVCRIHFHVEVHLVVHRVDQDSALLEVDQQEVVAAAVVLSFLSLKDLHLVGHLLEYQWRRHC